MKRLSKDHSVDDPIEFVRIKEKGGSIIKNRVEGALNVTRSIGDLMYKDKVLIDYGRF